MKDTAGLAEKQTILSDAFARLFDGTRSEPFGLSQQTADMGPSPASGPTVWFSRRDTEQHFEVRLNHPTEHWCHTVCRLILRQDGFVTFQTAFAADVLDYALPEDFIAQEAVNTILAEALNTDLDGPFANQGLGSRLLHNWQISKGRITRRWAENAANHMGMERLSNLVQYGRNFPALAAPTTRLGNTLVVGVADKGDGQGFKAISSVQEKSLRANYFNHKTIAIHDQFNTVEKFQVLQGVDEYLPQAKQAFLDARRYFTTAYPISVANAVADIRKKDDGFEITVTFDNNDHCRIVLSGSRWFQAWFTFPRLQCDLLIEWRATEKTFVIERCSTHEKRFVSTDILEECLSRALHIMLDVDPVFPAWLEKWFTAPPVVDHPLLQGRDLALRHQRLVGTVLGQPYATARASAERLAALRAKKAKKIEALPIQPEDFPDGTIFARLRPGVKAGASDLMRDDVVRLCNVMTIKTPGSKPGARGRRRILMPLDGLHMQTKPLTATHLVRFVPLTHPLAVQNLTDYLVGLSSREQIEIAYRLALDLPPATENPLLAGACELTRVKTDSPDVDVRLTQTAPQAGYALIAFRILRIMGALPIEDAGSGIAFLTTPNGEQTILLPSTQPIDAQQSTTERALLEHAISISQGARAETLLRRLRVAFAARRLSVV